MKIGFLLLFQVKLLDFQHFPVICTSSSVQHSSSGNLILGKKCCLEPKHFEKMHNLNQFHLSLQMCVQQSQRQNTPPVLCFELFCIYITQRFLLIFKNDAIKSIYTHICWSLSWRIIPFIPLKLHRDVRTDLVTLDILRL